MTENGREMGENSLESFLSVDIVATASSDNIFIKKSGGGVKGLPMSMHKCGKSGQKVIF